MSIVRLLFICFAAAAVLACSPSFKWRSMPLPALGLQASLPCKPERAERTVEMAGSELLVVMHSCSAGGATFGVACATVAQPDRAGVTLAHWRAAVLATAEARDLHDQPFQPAGALGLPQSLRTSGTGSMPGGTPMHLDAAWFSRVQGDAVRACHAIAYGPQLTGATADVFLNGLSLQ